MKERRWWAEEEWRGTKRVKGRRKKKCVFVLVEQSIERRKKSENKKG